jgi:hypothetical protein
MKTRLLYFILILLVVATACKKNSLPPETVESSPDFYIKGNLNGNTFLIEAGKNDYYMHSSHYHDTSNVNVYKGEFRQNTCNNCGYKLVVLINDYKISSASDPMFPDSAIRPGKYFFNDATPEPMEYEGTFTPLISGAATTYTWHYSDGVVSNDLQGKRKFRAGQTYSVTLKIDSAGNTAPPHTNVFRVGSPLQANVSVARATSSNLKYYFTGYSSIGSASASWELGDGSINVGASAVHTYTAINFYTAKLKLSNGSDYCESYYQIPAFYNYRIHANYNNSWQPVPNHKRLMAITFVVTDSEGNVYSSAMLNQPNNSNVEILSVESYKNNTNNELTKKVKIKFNCELKGSGGQINLSNGEAVIAVSYH